LTEKKEHLEKLEQQNSRLEHAVKQYQEREKHLAQIRVLEKKKPWAVSVKRCFLVAITSISQSPSSLLFSFRNMKN
jgi:benzoyl-CoA reductase/2-hydroxyglutaryl-CoA dehydratase subunit BcrC/BadD/HgdB